MFRVQGLDPNRFSHLFGLPDAALAELGARRHRVEASPGCPDRIAVRDMAVGETAILLNFEHQPARTPFRSSHAIFVAETPGPALDLVDALPGAIRIRPISLRAFDAAGEMLDAELASGDALLGPIERFLADPRVSCLHAHFAIRGCYAARIIRA